MTMVMLVSEQTAAAAPPDFHPSRDPLTPSVHSQQRPSRTRSQNEEADFEQRLIERELESEICQRFVRLSCEKMIASKNSRGGARLHRNLLILRLLRKARNDTKMLPYECSSLLKRHHQQPPIGTQSARIWSSLNASQPANATSPLSPSAQINSSGATIVVFDSKDDEDVQEAREQPLEAKGRLLTYDDEADDEDIEAQPTNAQRDEVFSSDEDLEGFSATMDDVNERIDDHILLQSQQMAIDAVTSAEDDEEIVVDVVECKEGQKETQSDDDSRYWRSEKVECQSDSFQYTGSFSFSSKQTWGEAPLEYTVRDRDDDSPFFCKEPSRRSSTLSLFSQLQHLNRPSFINAGPFSSRFSNSDPSCPLTQRTYSSSTFPHSSSSFSSSSSSSFSGRLYERTSQDGQLSFNDRMNRDIPLFSASFNRSSRSRHSAYHQQRREEETEAIEEGCDIAAQLPPPLLPMRQDSFWLPEDWDKSKEKKGWAAVPKLQAIIQQPVSPPLINPANSECEEEQPRHYFPSDLEPQSVLDNATDLSASLAEQPKEEEEELSLPPTSFVVEEPVDHHVLVYEYSSTDDDEDDGNEYDDDGAFCEGEEEEDEDEEEEEEESEAKQQGDTRKIGGVRRKRKTTGGSGKGRGAEAIQEKRRHCCTQTNGNGEETSDEQLTQASKAKSEKTDDGDSGVDVNVLDYDQPSPLGDQTVPAVLRSSTTFF